MDSFDAFNGNKSGKIDDTTRSLLERIEKLLKPYKRTAYIPQTKSVKSTFSISSKIGGFPYLRSKDDWPVCPNCQSHLQLFVQLNLSELPEQASEGLVQLFYCTNQDTDCDSELEGYLPFSKASVARKIEIEGKSSSITPQNESLFGEMKIISWEPKDDYPHSEEYYSMDADLEIVHEWTDLMHEHRVCQTLAGDKLFGWPYWVQGKENPSDRKTGKLMELLFQLDSEINLPYMFGDVGVGHLTQSPDNSDELAFGWACG